MRVRIVLAVLLLAIVAVAVRQVAPDFWLRLTDVSTLKGATAPETFDDVVRLVVSLAPDGRAPLAAAATEVGHWRFANRAGEIITTAGRAELSQALRTLAPVVEGKSDKLNIYLTSNSLFDYARSIDDLPTSAMLSVVIGGRAFPVRKTGEGAVARYSVVAAPGLHVEAGDRKLFDEVAWQLRRSLDKATVRTLAIEPGGNAVAGRMTQDESGTRLSRPGAVDPKQADRALQGLGGQVVLLAGRLSGDRLFYKPGTGAEGSVELADLWRAAANSDVNLVVLATSSPRQPGSRNWLWQRMGLSNSAKALEAANLGEFLHVLAGAPREITVSGRKLDEDRVEIEVTLGPGNGRAPGASVTDALKVTWSDIVSETAGSLAILGMRATFTRSTRQAELDRRLLPFIPSTFQVGYLVLLAVGLLALPVLRAWWQRIWPQEEAAEYGSKLAFILARIARVASFAVFFLPLAALPALFARFLGIADWSRTSQRTGSS